LENNDEQNLNAPLSSTSSTTSNHISPNAEVLNAHMPPIPIWRLLRDPYVGICAGILVMANVPLAFTSPTIAVWMEKTMNATESQVGIIWLSGFIPHLLGVYLAVNVIIKHQNRNYYSLKLF
jgi:hypothetical protein